jgi:hypothetical protein
MKQLRDAPVHRIVLLDITDPQSEHLAVLRLSRITRSLAPPKGR